MAKLILFSGACGSGKTTAIKALHNKLFNRGVKSAVLNELIRQKADKPIDEIRKNAHEYLKLQEQIIREKIEQEKLAISDTEYDVWIADRAVTDSLFYLESYVNKSELNEEDIKAYVKLHTYVKDYLFDYYKYYKLVQFEPIKITNSDKFRPSNLEYMQIYENSCISLLNSYYGFVSSNIHITVNLANTPQNDVLDRIIQFANL